MEKKYRLLYNGSVIGESKSLSYLNGRMTKLFCKLCVKNPNEKNRNYFVNESARVGEDVFTIEEVGTKSPKEFKVYVVISGTEDFGFSSVTCSTNEQAQKALDISYLEDLKTVKERKLELISAMKNSHDYYVAFYAKEDNYEGCYYGRIIETTFDATPLI